MFSLPFKQEQKKIDKELVMQLYKEHGVLDIKWDPSNECVAVNDNEGEFISKLYVTFNKLKKQMKDAPCLTLNGIPFDAIRAHARARVDVLQSSIDYVKTDEKKLVLKVYKEERDKNKILGSLEDYVASDVANIIGSLSKRVVTKEAMQHVLGHVFCSRLINNFMAALNVIRCSRMLVYPISTFLSVPADSEEDEEEFDPFVCSHVFSFMTFEQMKDVIQSVCTLMETHHITPQRVKEMCYFSYLFHVCFDYHCYTTGVATQFPTSLPPGVTLYNGKLCLDVALKRYEVVPASLTEDDVKNVYYMLSRSIDKMEDKVCGEAAELLGLGMLHPFGGDPESTRDTFCYSVQNCVVCLRDLKNDDHSECAQYHVANLVLPQEQKERYLSRAVYGWEYELCSHAEQRFQFFYDLAEDSEGNFPGDMSKTVIQDTYYEKTTPHFQVARKRKSPDH